MPRVAGIASLLLVTLSTSIQVNIAIAAEPVEPVGLPNIIFILADDLGYGDLGCFGQEYIKTPHLDRLCEEGMKLTSHYAGSTVCAPSRRTLLTGQKRTLYEGGVRVPTIAWWPGTIQAGAVRNYPSVLYDWLPTFAELAGVEIEDPTDGVSLAPMLFGKADKRPEEAYIFWDYNEKGVSSRISAMRKGQWKLIVHRQKAANSPELYDLSTDLAEQHDQAKERPEVVQELLPLLKQWWRFSSRSRFLHDSSRTRTRLDQPAIREFPGQCPSPGPSPDVVLNDDLDPWFNQAYVTLKTRGLFAAGFGGVGGRGNLPPRSVGAAASRLWQLIQQGHGGVELSLWEKDMIYWWIESWCTYSGTFASLNKDPNRRIMVDKKLLQRRCGDCHSDVFRFSRHHGPSAADVRETFGLRVNYTQPEMSLLLRAPLSKEAGELEICRDRKATMYEGPRTQPNWELGDAPAAPTFTSKDNPDYRSMLQQIREASERYTPGRLERPGFTPHHDWVREMKRNGALPKDLETFGSQDIQFYFDIDERYYRNFWPVSQGGT